MPAYETHIAILGEPPVAGILAVNAPDAVVVYHGHLRNFLGKFSELNKKRPREIVIYSQFMLAMSSSFIMAICGTFLANFLN